MPAPPAGPVGVPVVVDRDTILTLYGSIAHFSAADRARRLEATIQAYLASGAARGPQDTLWIADSATAGFTDVMFGNQVVVRVVKADAEGLGVPQIEAARIYVRALKAKVPELRARFGTAALFRSLAIAAALTVLLLAAFALLRRGFKHVYRRLDVASGAPVPALRLGRVELIPAHRVSRGLTVLARTLRIALSLAVTYVWLWALLKLFPVTEHIADQLARSALQPLTTVGLGILDYLPQLVEIVVIVLVTRMILWFIHPVFRGLGAGTLTLGNFDPDWADPTYKIVRTVVLLLATVLVLPLLPGSGSDAFKGISVFVALLLSLGSSSAIANVVAGVVLTYTRAFRVGDWVTIGDTTGAVVSRSLLATRVRTSWNENVTIPSSVVLAAKITNFSHREGEERTVLRTSVTIGYDAPWRQVHELLLAAARKTSQVLPTPEPFVLQRTLGDYWVAYDINVYVERAHGMVFLLDELHRNIQDEFNGAGVEIMSPAFTAIRDGNQVTIPSQHRPQGYQAPAFRIRQVDPPTE